MSISYLKYDTVYEHRCCLILESKCDMCHFILCLKGSHLCFFLHLQGWHMVVRAARVSAPSPAPPPTALRLSPRVCPGHRAWTLTLPPVKRGKSLSNVLLYGPSQRL